MSDNVRRISKQLAAYGTADVAVLAVNFLLLPVYTRVLSTTEYGALALLLVCEAFLKVLFRWGLDGGFLRFYYDRPTDEDRHALAGTIAAFLVVANGALLALLLSTAGPFSRLLFDSDQFTTAYRLLAINSFAATFLFLPLNLLRIQERARLFASLTFLRSFGTIAIRLVLIVGLGFGVLGLVLADVIVTAALLIALAPTLKSMLAPRFSLPLLRELLRYGMPQIPHGVLSQTMGMADRVVLGFFLPLQAVGLYLIGNTIAGLLKLYPVAFEAAWMPFAFDSMQRPDARMLFARLATYACTVLALAAVIVAGFGGIAIAVLLPAEYLAAAGIIPTLVLGMTIQSLAWFFATSLNIAKKTRVYPVVTAIGAAASLVSNLALIPRFGLFGAALSVVVSQTLATGATLYFAQRAYHIPYEVSRLMKLAAVSVATYLAMIAIPVTAPWEAIAVRAGLLALFPLGLYGFRFFEPHELGSLRELVRSLA